MKPIRSVIVLGGGSAGFLAAIAIRNRRPDLDVRVVRSKDIPIIGVGEGTTAAILRALHCTLRIDPKEFYDVVRPIWKLGIRYLWGPRPSFNFTFGAQLSQAMPLSKSIGYYLTEDMTHASLDSSLMDSNRPFPRDQGTGLPFISRCHAYHLENKTFVAYLESVALRRGATIVDDTVVNVPVDEGGVRRLELKSGANIEADLYVDCSGFVSELLGKTLKEPFISFRSTLFCDRAVIGGWERGPDEQIQPYTVAETMNAGWAWRIDHEHLVNRGYVYCSSFITDDEADREFRAKNPKVKNTRVIKFITGRYARSWVKNVVAIGNASGFVEPLEATAIAAICEQTNTLSAALAINPALGPNMAALGNNRDERYWDAIRRFLAVHYAFNTRLDTPFWREAREKTDLAGAERIVEYYKENGPNAAWAQVMIDPVDQFGIEGYLTMLVGQRVPHGGDRTVSPHEVEYLRQHRAKNMQTAMNGYTVEQALPIVRLPNWNWRPGFFD
jgi:tryptophan halogenase